MRLQIRLHDNPCSAQLELFLMLSDGARTFAPVLPPGGLSFRKHEEGSRIEPICHSDYADKSSLQTLMDDLWAIGLRPAVSKATDGQIEALKYHLEDMRKLAFRGTMTANEIRAIEGVVK